MKVKVRSLPNGRFAGSSRRRFPSASGTAAAWVFTAVFVLSVGLASRVGAAEDSLLLRDYHPQSMMHLPETKVERARFPVIDVYCRQNEASDMTQAHPSAAELVARMDRCNLKRAVILTGGWGESLQHVVDEMVKPYPDRFTVFCELDWSKVNEPGFSDAMVKLLRDSVQRGARGLKIYKSLGLEYRDVSGKLIPVDDSRLDPVWAECARLGIPVAIHVGDPSAFFVPCDATNDRYEELQAHPDWGFAGKDFPSLTNLLQAAERVFAKHPQTSFIWLNMGNWPENLDYIGAVLHRRANVVVDISARQGELGCTPRRTRKFFTEFQDRALFGADTPLTEEVYRNYYRWLETEDEYFDYFGAPGQGRFKIYGLGLSDTVLEKIYHLNAERVFGQFKGESQPK